MVKDDTLYKRIGVSPTATKEEIRKQYKLLSKTAHPDKNRDNIEEANRLYQEINQAKDILLDDEKRQLYDQIGMDIINGGSTSTEMAFDPSMFGGFGGMGGMFGGMGGMFGGMGAANRNNKQHENITETLNITLDQLYCEHTVELKYKYKACCTKCLGNGTNDGKPGTCCACNGAGVKIQVTQIGNMIQQSQSECYHCKGQGTLISELNKCPACQGKTYVFKEKTISIPLRKAMSSENKLHLAGHGHQFKERNTDLILSIHELPHKLFKRQGTHLLTTVDLRLYQALSGFTKVIEHLDGRKLTIACHGRTEFQAVRKLPNEGLLGDLYVKFNVLYPDAANEYGVQLKTLLKLMEPEEVARETALKSTKPAEVALASCVPAEGLNILRMFEQGDTKPAAQPQTRQSAPQQAQCAQQ